MTFPKILGALLVGAIKETEAVGYPATCQFLYLG